MRFQMPRFLLGRPSVAFAPSRILPCSCTTRYGEAPCDDDILGQVPDTFGIRPSSLPWFPAAHQDTPSGTVWTVFACPPLDPATRGNPPDGSEPGGDDSPEFVLPQALWAFALLAEGSAPSRRLLSPSGIWLSRWDEDRVVSLEGPFPPDADLPSCWSDVRDAGEEVSWRGPLATDLRNLAADNPEAQMLSPGEDRRRRDRLATRASLSRSAVVALAALAAALVVQVPAWFASRSLAATEARLSSVRGDLERLDRIRQSSRCDAAYVEASAQALRPSGSPVGVLDGIARRLPSGVRLLSFQLESPPGETGWEVRTDVRLPDWRGVASFVDSVKLVPGVREVRVATQQRDQEAVHLALQVRGDWP